MQEKKKIAQGRRGEIWLEEKEGISLATKKARSEQTRGPLLKESQILQYLNDQGIGFVPQIQDVLGDGFTYLRIEGSHFDEVFDAASIHEQHDLLRKLLLCAKQLDTVGVIHGELLRPFTNVLVNKIGSIFIIDFERGKFEKHTTKNTKHVLQRMTGLGYLSVDELRSLSSRSLEELYEAALRILDIAGEGTGNQSFPNSFGVKNLEVLSRDGLGESWQYGLLNTLRMLISIILLLGLDQLTKLLFVGFGFFAGSPRIQASFNTGIAWSLPVPRGVILSLSALLLIGVYGYRIQETRQHKIRRDILTSLVYFKVGVAGILSGGLGNLLDRMLLGHVRDFIDMSPLITFYQRPIFNIADICIVVGVMSLMVYEWKKD